MNNNYVHIGFTKKAFGFKGEIKLHIEKAFVDDFNQVKVVFLELNGKHVPFFLEKRNTKNATVAKFEDIDSKEETVDIVSKKIYLRKEDLIPETNRKEIESELQFYFCKGFELVDIELGSIGMVQDILAYPQQEMAFVLYKEKEILIPLNESLIEKIDPKSKKIWMDLPHGLLMI